MGRSKYTSAGGKLSCKNQDCDTTLNRELIRNLADWNIIFWSHWGKLTDVAAVLWDEFAWYTRWLLRLIKGNSSSNKTPAVCQKWQCLFRLLLYVMSLLVNIVKHASKYSLLSWFPKCAIHVLMFVWSNNPLCPLCVPSPFSSSSSPPEWCSSSQLHIQWQTRRQTGSWSTCRCPPLSRTTPGQKRQTNSFRVFLLNS